MIETFNQELIDKPKLLEDSCNTKHRYIFKNNKKMPENKAIGKIGGGMFILILVILFFAAHGGSNEMMYITLAFVFIVIALFSYGFWSAVSKGDGIWQYMGKQNLQHQQISNPNYHFGSVRNYKRTPHSNVHICAPPKMGGARLNIYTIPLNSSRRNSSIHLNNSSNHSRNNSVKKKYEENEEEVKVEVYCDSNNDKEFEEIQIPIPNMQ